MAEQRDCTTVTNDSSRLHQHLENMNATMMRGLVMCLVVATIAVVALNVIFPRNDVESATRDPRNPVTLVELERRLTDLQLLQCAVLDGPDCTQTDTKSGLLRSFNISKAISILNETQHIILENVTDVEFTYPLEKNRNKSICYQNGGKYITWDDLDANSTVEDTMHLVSGLAATIPCGGNISMAEVIYRDSMIDIVYNVLEVYDMFADSWSILRNGVVCLEMLDDLSLSIHMPYFHAMLNNQQRMFSDVDVGTALALMKLRSGSDLEANAIYRQLKTLQFKIEQAIGGPDALQSITLDIDQCLSVTSKHMNMDDLHWVLPRNDFAESLSIAHERCSQRLNRLDALNYTYTHVDVGLSPEDHVTRAAYGNPDVRNALRRARDFYNYQ